MGEAEEGGGKADGPLGLALGLMALAGGVDAIGFLKLGHLFVSFMSGNSTQLSVSLATGRPAQAAQPAAILLLFVLGSFAGPLIVAAIGDRRRRPVLLALEAVLLAGAALIGGAEIDGPRVGAAISLAAFAIGLQNSVQHTAHGARVHPFVTSNLVSFAEALARTLLGQAKAAESLRHLLLWASLVGGAGVGAGLYARFGLPALLGPAALFALLSLREFVQPDPQPASRATP